MSLALYIFPFYRSQTQLTCQRKWKRQIKREWCVDIKDEMTHKTQSKYWNRLLSKFFVYRFINLTVSSRAFLQESKFSIDSFKCIVFSWFCRSIVPQFIGRQASNKLSSFSVPSRICSFMSCTFVYLTPHFQATFLKLSLSFSIHHNPTGWIGD